MSLQSSSVRFGQNETFSGYLTYLESKQTLPGLLLIQEAWGLDAHIRDVAERFAKAGYLVLAPDLFARQGLRPEPLSEPRMQALLAFINTLPPSAWGNPQEREAALAKLPTPLQGQVRESYDALFNQAMAQRAEHLQILAAAGQYLRQQVPACQGRKIGSLGFCMGGGLSGALAAQDPDLGAAVIFYGQPIPKEAVPQVHCKVLAFYGELDKRLVDSLPEFINTMKMANKPLECHVYQGAAHAFFNDTRPSYNPSAARQAFARSLGFLNENLS